MDTYKISSGGYPESVEGVEMTTYLRDTILERSLARLKAGFGMTLHARFFPEFTLRVPKGAK